jgi:hypothetical protein
MQIFYLMMPDVLNEAWMCYFYSDLQGEARGEFERCYALSNSSYPFFFFFLDCLMN